MIYFDNAATSFPKPAAVRSAAAESMRVCGNPGRGSHSLSMRAAEEVYLCRMAAGAMFGASPEHVIFTSGATMSLNLAIKAAHEKFGGAILISDLEHNSVRRPAIAAGEVRIFDSAVELSDEVRTEAILASIASLSDGAGVLVCTAASNICGASMPIREIGRFCRSHGIFFIVDGAQAGGILPLDMEADCIDALCLPGHKGLYGPMGVGLLILGEDVEIAPLLLGGSGVDSRADFMPELPPERYEAGTLALPAIAGLRAGIEFVRWHGLDNICAHEKKLADRLKTALSDKFGERVKLYAPQHDGGIVLFHLAGIDAEDVARLLDEAGICVRAGLHCAPLAHKRLGSESAVRVSFGVHNTPREVNVLLRELSYLL